MTNPFDFINAINYTKKDLIRDSDNPEIEEKGYSPFMVNRGLSYFMDTLFYANEMNSNYTIDNKLQFDFLINSISPKKRFAKWAKKDKSADLEFVMEYFNYNVQKAKAALNILSKEQIKELKKKVEESGVSK